MIKDKILSLYGFAVGSILLILIVVPLFIKTISNGDLDWLIFKTEIEQGKIIAERVESFRHIHNRVPNDEEFVLILKQLSLYRAEESCPCYTPEANNYDYSIEYPGLTTGEMFIYESKSHEWRRGGA
jgi:hypothetical protein